MKTFCSQQIWQIQVTKHYFGHLSKLKLMYANPLYTTPGAWGNPRRNSEMRGTILQLTQSAKTNEDNTCRWQPRKFFTRRHNSYFRPFFAQIRIFTPNHVHMFFCSRWRTVWEMLELSSWLGGCSEIQSHSYDFAPSYKSKACIFVNEITQF